MSLTSNLVDKDSPVARYLAGQFPNLKPLYESWRAEVEGVETIRPSGQIHWGTIGTAIDYRLRYYFGTTPWKSLVAALGAGYFIDEVWIERISRFALALTSTLKDLCPVGRLLDTRQERELCRYCYVLALFEQMYRSRQATMTSPLLDIAEDATANELLDLASQTAIDDLTAMAWRFFETQHHLFGHDVTLNPTFDGSREIGGADADLLIDHSLIEIKTVTDPIKGARRKELFYQLLGYVLLDYSNKYAIDEVGVYLARQGVLIKWPLYWLMKTLADADVSLMRTRLDFRAVLVDSHG